MRFSSAAERVLKFSFLYTHYICGGVNKFLFCILGVKIGTKKCPIFLPTKSDRILCNEFRFFICMSTFTEMLISKGVYIGWIRNNFRGLPLRSNIPRSALCATLNTYNFEYFFYICVDCFCSVVVVASSESG
jgi:hypothetical protein